MENDFNKKYKTLESYILEECKKKKTKTPKGFERLLRNFSLNNVLIEEFINNFGLEDEGIESIIEFIQKPDNAYELSKYGHRKEEVLNTINKRPTKDNSGDRDYYGEDYIL